MITKDKVMDQDSIFDRFAQNFVKQRRAIQVDEGYEDKSPRGLDGGGAAAMPGGGIG